ncbi:MAG: hypothetical protein ABR555_19535 [Pyrinomonadaceae bacterium]
MSRESQFRTPFKFKLASLLERAQHLPAKIDGVSIRLPFVNVTVKPDNVERKVAREIVIRLADRRVLNSFECCDGCIESALKSLQEIRSILVDKQVELSDRTDGSLYLMLEIMLEGLRQFFTFEQRLNSESDGRHKHYSDREIYFAALEMLRAHLYRSLSQVASIAGVDIPKVSEHMRYDTAWRLDAYERPALPPITGS